MATCILRAVYPRAHAVGVNLILRVSACGPLSVLMLSCCLVFRSPGAVGARLLSGPSKPTNMDVDEEENMSESTRLPLNEPACNLVPPCMSGPLMCNQCQCFLLRRHESFSAWLFIRIDNNPFYSTFKPLNPSRAWKKHINWALLRSSNTCRCHIFIF